MTRFREVLRSLNCDGAAGLALAAFWLALVGMAAFGDEWRDLLRYDRSGIAAGEYWRLLSAHIVHLDVEHAALNALGLVLMWALFVRDHRPLAWVAIAVVSALAIDGGLWRGSPQVEWYVGLSGVLHGVMAAGTWVHLRRGDPDRWILAGFLVAKLAWEQFAGALPFESTGAVIVQAHLYGALGGLAVALILPRRSRSL